MAKIKVRATQDGTYGGYYRHGPIESDQGNIPGEIFEVEDKVYELKDEHDRPIYETDEFGKPIPIMANGKQKVDPATGRQMYKVKTACFFSPVWMERVNDNAEVTYDHPEFQQPAVYRIKRPRGQGPAVVAMPTAPVSAESPI